MMCFTNEETADTVIKILEASNPTFRAIEDKGNKLGLSGQHILKIAIIILAKQNVEFAIQNAEMGHELWQKNIDKKLDELSDVLRINKIW